MSMLFFYSILVSMGYYLIINVSYWVMYNRFSSLKTSSYSLFKSSLPAVFTMVLFFSMTRYVFMMSTANIPMFFVPTMFYSYVLFNALVFWVPIVGYALVTNFKGFMSHMLPYGAPVGLMLFLPLVEIFSQIIRPLTLTIRFATNLSAGHIMMFMFSYFAVLSAALSPLLYIVLFVLLIMEIFIAFLQSYIFLTLLGLYLTETIE
uniref:F-ATPase protein 6 n=1 Tax=Asplanchna sp. TaxID=3231738 RepID=A0AB39A6C9_9BILA